MSRDNDNSNNKHFIGAYGRVDIILDEYTKQYIAVKTIDSRRSGEIFDSFEEELKIFDACQHSDPRNCITRLIEVNANDRQLVMEYVGIDLLQYLKHLKMQKKRRMRLSDLRSILFDIFTALKHLHSNKIVHGDIKAQNVLLWDDDVPSKQKHAKLCDFGLSHFVKYKRPCHLVSCLWYRAPELLMDCTNYTTSVDIWSVGMLCLHMMVQEVVFDGELEMDQLCAYFSVFGEPCDKRHPELNALYTDGMKKLYLVNKAEEREKNKGKNLRHVRNHKLRDLLERVLCMDPSKRITAADALKHAFFCC